MLGNFRTSRPHNHFLLLIYGLFLKWPLFLHPMTATTSNYDGYLYIKIVSFLSRWPVNPSILFSSIVFLLLYLQALALNEIVNEQKLFAKPHHLTAMCYLLFTSVFPDWFVFSPVLLIATFLVFILSRICGLQGHNNTNRTFFNIGLLLGISVLCSFSSVVFLLLILLGLTITRAFRLNEWIIVLLGILTPAYFLWSALFLSGVNTQVLYPMIHPGVPSLKFNMYGWVAVSIICLTSLIGFFFARNHMLKLLVQSRRSWGLLYLFLLFSMALPFFNAGTGAAYFLPLVLVLSVFAASAYHYPEKKWFSVFSHWSIFLLATMSGYFFLH